MVSLVPDMSPKTDFHNLPVQQSSIWHFSFQEPTSSLFRAWTHATRLNKVQRVSSRNIVIAIHTFIWLSFQCGQCRYGRPFENVKAPRFWQAALRIISVTETQTEGRLCLGWMVYNFCAFSLLPHECTIGQRQGRKFRGRRTVFTAGVLLLSFQPLALGAQLMTSWSWPSS